jgi:hypothetical protein
MESFVLTGKAKQVFRTIELKAKREEELNEAMKNLSIEVRKATEAEKAAEHPCPIDGFAKCSVPMEVPCSKITTSGRACPVWLESNIDHYWEGHYEPDPRD